MDRWWPLGALVLVVSCDAARVDEGPRTVCGAVFPGLRIAYDDGCSASLRVVIGGRAVEPSPRTVVDTSATLLAWPSWAAEGMPSYVELGAVRTEFTAHPYQCQVVEATCPGL